MMAAPLYPGGLIEIQRANLRALLRHLFREKGTWIAVAHAVSFRRSVVLAFMDGIEPGHMALARSIARTVGLSLDDALTGKASPRKAPALVLVTPPKRKGGAS
ncbi:hypothetical protein GF068_20100 [Polyangium spumosum]|uniref:XRE family transcriptional regulator n=2 Tax=Polyangium spumosum TaxID=889282 RepID=A0A6N7PVC0_9BACT|nr:hypothetical protein [Polyangium spumosum]